MGYENDGISKVNRRRIYARVSTAPASITTAEALKGNCFRWQSQGWLPKRSPDICSRIVIFVTAIGDFLGRGFYYTRGVSLLPTFLADDREKQNTSVPTI